MTDAAFMWPNISFPGWQIFVTIVSWGILLLQQMKMMNKSENESDDYFNNIINMEDRRGNNA